MSTVFSITPYRNVHEVTIKTEKGRFFVIDIYDSNSSNYDSTVTVFDRVSNQSSAGQLYNITPASSLANDNFEAAIVFIKSYLTSIDPTDPISEIHNPCNCPFVSENNQNTIASGLGISTKVRVN
jgi:hypothetical protein